MIVCKYDELNKYQALLPNLEHALKCVEGLRKNGFPEGRYEYENGFLFVQRGQTKPYNANAYEVHRRYIDVQYMIKGEEIAYYESLGDLEVYKDYVEDTDIAFYEKKGALGNFIKVGEGTCWIAFPSEAHMPCRNPGETQNYLKIVMKLFCA